MGDFIEISFGNCESNEIRIDFSVHDTEGRQYDFNTAWIIDPSNNLPRLNLLQVTSARFEVKDGQIVGAPREFFDTYMMDVMEIALQA